MPSGTSTCRLLCAGCNFEFRAFRNGQIGPIMESAVGFPQDSGRTIGFEPESKYQCLVFSVTWFWVALKVFGCIVSFKFSIAGFSGSGSTCF
jgi:hypothetical protein